MEPVIPLGRSNHGRSLIPKEKIMCFLYYSGHSDSNVTAASHLECAEGTIFNSFHKVIEAMHAPNPRYNGKSFVEEQIRLPTADVALARGETFLNKQPFPKNFPACIIGCIDGMHAKASNIILNR